MRVTDAMAMDSETPTVARVVEGLRGEVPMRSELAIRFDYGWIVPWVTRHDGGVAAIAGPDKLRMRSWVAHRGEGYATVADFLVREGQQVPFTLTWHESNPQAPAGLDAEGVIRDADEFWRAWSDQCQGDCCCTDEAVIRSLLTLKGLTYAPDRRHRRGADDLAPREGRRRAELGLPLLLAPRRDLHPARAAQRRLPRGGACLAATGCSAPSPAGRTASRSCTAWRASAG